MARILMQSALADRLKFVGRHSVLWQTTQSTPPNTSLIFVEFCSRWLRSFGLRLPRSFKFQLLKNSSSKRRNEPWIWQLALKGQGTISPNFLAWNIFDS